jgi:hypothetical protein
MKILRIFLIILFSLCYLSVFCTSAFSAEITDMKQQVSPSIICLYKWISEVRVTTSPPLIKPVEPFHPYCVVTKGVKITNTSNKQIINGSIVGTRKIEGTITHINDKLRPINPGQKVYKEYVANTPFITPPLKEMTSPYCYLPKYEFSVLLHRSSLKFGCRAWDYSDGPW